MDYIFISATTPATKPKSLDFKNSILKFKFANFAKKVEMELKKNITVYRLRNGKWIKFVERKKGRKEEKKNEKQIEIGRETICFPITFPNLTRCPLLKAKQWTAIM